MKCSHPFSPSGVFVYALFVCLAMLMAHGMSYAKSSYTSRTPSRRLDYGWS
jgi:hypothetical protein